MSNRILPAVVAVLCLLDTVGEWNSRPNALTSTAVAASGLGCLPREEAKAVVDGGLGAAQILCVFGSAITDAEAVRQFCRIAQTPGIGSVLEMLVGEREAARAGRAAGLAPPARIGAPASRPAADGGR